MVARLPPIWLALALALAAPACSTSPAAPRAGDAAAKDARAMDAREAGRAADASRDSGNEHTCTLSVPSPPDWHLVTDGPLFKDGLGRIVFLRGVDAGGRSKFSPYVPFDYPDSGYSASLDAYMAHAESWGIDAMRVPFTWAALEPTQATQTTHTYDSGWIGRYIALLTSAWQHGIYTIVDFHQDVYSEALCGDGFPGWTLADAGPPHHDCPSWQLEYFNDPAVEAAFDAFWPTGSKTMAGYFAVWDEMISQVAGVPGVIGFEPFNEPAAGTANLATFEATTLTPFYSAIAAEMNAKAPKALVFFDASELDGVTVTTNLGKPSGQNLVFAPHFYPVGETAPSAVQMGLSHWAAVGTTWNVPVFVGEFGASNAQPTTLPYMQAVFGGLDALGLSGTEWEYSVSSQLWNSETDGVTTADGGEFPVAQALVRPFARAVAGANVSQSFDPTTGTYSLSYTAQEGVTEVRVPARAYPTSRVVSVTGGCIDAKSQTGEILIGQTTPGAPVTLTVEQAK